MGTARTKGAVWAWLVVIGCIGFYSIPTGIIGNTSGIFVAPVMDQFGWTQTDTTMYRTIQPLVAAVCAPIAGKLMEKYNPRWILAAVSAWHRGRAPTPPSCGSGTSTAWCTA